MQTETRQAGWRPRTLRSAARRQHAVQLITGCCLLSALALLPHCHASFICCWPGIYWSYCHLDFIGHIVIWILLVILSFGFKS
jgi:hypothetical protein